jgi:hypothetical protein
MILDTSYFIGPITIEGIGEASVDERLTVLIGLYEPEFLQKALGYEFATLFSNGAAAPTPDARWTNLKQGTTYTYDGHTYNYRGLAHAGASLFDRYSPIAKYVYCMWLRDTVTSVGRMGGVQSQTENATRVDSMQKQCDVWNSIFQDLVELYRFLNRQPLIYPEFDNTRAEFYCGFHRKNPWNL